MLYKNLFLSWLTSIKFHGQMINMLHLLIIFIIDINPKSCEKLKKKDRETNETK